MINYYNVFFLLLSQTPLIVVYFIKRYFDLKSKKQEINYNLFQSCKIEAVRNFFQSYTETMQMWQQLPIYPILENKLNPKEIDEMIFPKINKVESVVIELKMYFNETDLEPFNSILNNFKYLNGNIQQEWRNVYTNENLIPAGNHILSIIDNYEKSNNAKIKEIVDIVAESLKKGTFLTVRN